MLSSGYVGEEQQYQTHRDTLLIRLSAGEEASKTTNDLFYFFLPIQSDIVPESAPITQMKAVNWHRDQRQGGNRVDIDVASTGAAIGAARETSMKCDIESRNVRGGGGGSVLSRVSGSAWTDPR